MALSAGELPRRRLLDGGDARAGGVTVLVAVLAGVPLGLLWQLLAPRAEIATSAAGQLVLASVEDKAFIAADATLFLLGAAVGAVGGGVAWWRGRRSASGVVLGLAVGGLLAGVVALQVGELVDGARGSFADGDRSAGDGVPLAVPNVLLSEAERSPVVLLGAPAAATLVFAGLVALRPQDLPDE